MISEVAKPRTQLFVFPFALLRQRLSVLSRSISQGMHTPSSHRVMTVNDKVCQKTRVVLGHPVPLELRVLVCESHLLDRRGQLKVPVGVDVRKDVCGEVGHSHGETLDEEKRNRAEGDGVNDSTASNPVSSCHEEVSVMVFVDCQHLPLPRDDLHLHNGGGQRPLTETRPMSTRRQSPRHRLERDCPLFLQREPQTLQLSRQMEHLDAALDLHVIRLLSLSISLLLPVSLVSRTNREYAVQLRHAHLDGGLPILLPRHSDSRPGMP
mmetsp:Transcript_52328/g.102425  ORF Transcript_52328/g.102425 Transcript_52328/m.102425 type:complete len:266 (+) Transcript_52328:1590-2387(+)